MKDILSNLRRIGVNYVYSGETKKELEDAREHYRRSMEAFERVTKENESILKNGSYELHKAHLNAMPRPPIIPLETEVSLDKKIFIIFGGGIEIETQSFTIIYEERIFIKEKNMIIQTSCIQSISTESLFY